MAKKTTNAERIVIPRPLALEILEFLSQVQDCGPLGEGWKSEELISTINMLVDLLWLPKSKKWR